MRISLDTNDVGWYVRTRTTDECSCCYWSSHDQVDGFGIAFDVEYRCNK